MPHTLPGWKDLPSQVTVRAPDHHLLGMRRNEEIALCQGTKGAERMSRTKKDVMRDASELRPTVHVGKDGITDELVEEVKLQLKTRKVIKMRLLDSSGEDPKATAEMIAERSNATLVDVRGSVAVLCEKRYFAGKPMSVE
jgi:RNA-binding protein